MPRINRVMMAGRVVRDFVLRYTTDEIPVARFSLAFNRRVNVGREEWKEVPGFIDVLVSHRLAEQCAERLRKGSPVYLEGRLQMRKSTSQGGASRSTLEIKADTVQFLDRHAEGDGPGNTAPPPARPVEGDLPF